MKMAEVQTNDERILSLKKQIEEKKKQLKDKNIRFTPMTNCMLELDGVKYNLHTVTDWFPLIKLELMEMAAERLKIDVDDIIISGYPLSMWIKDVRSKMDSEKYKLEKKKLDDLEKQLTNLLSDTKQTELKIDELEAMLNL